MSGGILNLQTEGMLEVQSAGTLSNSGTINSGVGMNNRGFIDVLTGGSLTNFGTVNVKGMRDTTIATFNSAGNVTNTGTIAAGDGVNSGGIRGETANAFTNTSPGTIQINGRGVLILCASSAFQGTGSISYTSPCSELRYISANGSAVSIMASDIEFPPMFPGILRILQSSLGGAATLQLNGDKTMNAACTPIIRCDTVCTLDMQNRSLTVGNNKVWIDGFITNSNSSSLTFNGSSSANEIRLRFGGSQTIQNLTLNRSDSLILRSSLTISNTLNLQDANAVLQIGTSNTLTVKILQAQVH
jgi:hypothetical protein